MRKGRAFAAATVERWLLVFVIRRYDSMEISDIASKLTDLRARFDELRRYL